MAVLDELLKRIGLTDETHRRPSLHYECRRCGTTLGEERPACPTCGSNEIATISL